VYGTTRVVETESAVDDQSTRLFFPPGVAVTVPDPRAPASATKSDTDEDDE